MESSPHRAAGRPARPLRACGRVGAVLLALALAAAAGAQSSDWQLRYDAGAERVVLRLDERFGELRADDPGPVLRIHGDGLASLHVPVYMKRAGDYRLQLSPPELQELLESAARSGLLDFEPVQVRALRQQQLQARRRAGEPLHERSDPTVTRIELSLAAVQPPGGALRRDVEARVVWPDLRADARRFPGLEALGGLAAFRERLDALMQRPDWRRASPGAAAGP